MIAGPRSGREQRARRGPKVGSDLVVVSYEPNDIFLVG